MRTVFEGELLPRSGLVLPPALRERLLRAYAEPARVYHTAAHVREVLEHCRDLGRELPWQQPREIALAVCLHDAVYVPGRRDNEARSAELARAEIALEPALRGVDAGRVAHLIGLTARHGRLRPDQVDAEAARFLDCDMAILAASPQRFDDYDRAIAAEYRHAVPAFVFRIRRRRFLRGLLASPAIYLSTEGRARWEADARANLRRALGIAAPSRGSR
jgi:predicted metal-dependent HD superfamily phosphohydrolase